MFCAHHLGKGPRGAVRPRDGARPGAPVRDREECDAAHVPAHVRLPPAGGRCGCGVHSAHSGAQLHCDDTDLPARQPAAPARDPDESPPALEAVEGRALPPSGRASWLAPARLWR